MLFQYLRLDMKNINTNVIYEDLHNSAKTSELEN